MAQGKNETQIYRLFDLLSKAGETGVTKAEIVTKLGVKETSVPVYIHSLRSKFKAEIKNVTAGRVVTGYILTNAPNVTQFKRVPTPIIRKSAGAVSSENQILDKEVDTTYGDSEVADIGSSLGLSGNGFGQDY